MSKEVWVRAYEQVWDEDTEGVLTEEELCKRADERAASLEADLVEEAMARLEREY